MHTNYTARMIDQWRSLKWLLIALYLPVIALLGSIVALGDDWANYLLRDPHTLADMPFFAGMISNIGVLCWTATAAICLFSGANLRGARGQGAMSAFLLYAGGVTTLLMLDDFFLLHEDLFRYYLPLPEGAVYAVYAALLLGLVVGYREVIAMTDYLLLVIACVLFGISVSIDLMQPLMSAAQYGRIGGYALEDGVKFAGILTWTVYFIRVCHRACSANAARSHDQ